MKTHFLFFSILFSFFTGNIEAQKKLIGKWALNRLWDDTTLVFAANNIKVCEKSLLKLFNDALINHEMDSTKAFELIEKTQQELSKSYAIFDEKGYLTTFGYNAKGTVTTNLNYTTDAKKKTINYLNKVEKTEVTVNYFMKDNFLYVINKREKQEMRKIK